MTITSGNFQDLVQLSADTLYHLGPDFEVGNSSLGSSATVGFVNSAGVLALVGAATGNASAFLPPGGGTLGTGNLSAINVSAGTTSNNMSAVTFSNLNNVSFGLNGSVVTASATVASSQGSVNFSGGTTSNNLSAITFSNSNNVSFGLNGATMTAAAQINISAGAAANNLSAVTFSNSNGVSFGLAGSVVTASVAAGQNGSMSSWSNGNPVTALSGGVKTLFFQPMIIPYNITVTNLLWLASVANSTTNVSGGFSASAALYSLNAGSFSQASSASTNVTWTSGAALSSNTGINYRQMTCSWVVTSGPYLFAWWISTQNSASMSYYGPPAQPAIASGQNAAMSTLALNGYSQATVAALPTSFGITNTSGYLRTGATAAQQPFIIMQGT